MTAEAAAKAQQQHKQHKQHTPGIKRLLSAIALGYTSA